MLQRPASIFWAALAVALLSIAPAAVVMAGLAKPRRPSLPDPAEIQAAIPSPRVILRLSGSNTVGSRLATAWAAGFLRRTGATAVEIRRAPRAGEWRVVGQGPSGAEAIEVHAHGTLVGFSDLRSGLCDVVMASRRITPLEVEGLRREGDLSRLARFLKRRPRTVLLVGFAPGKESPEASRGEAARLARRVAQELARRGVVVDRTLSLGAALLLDDDAMPLGRWRNRRVEVWIR